MNLYRFSPITDEQSLVEAVKYVATKTTELVQTIIGKTFPISSLTIFSHYPDEFKTLVEISKTLGTPHSENNGPRVTLTQPITVGNNTVTQLRIRKPDPYRSHVGCNDFDTAGYQEFKSQFLKNHPESLRLIVRDGYEMIEFHHPDYDVLAYVVSD